MRSLLYKLDTFLLYFKRGIRSSIKWFPIIWKDLDFDHWFMFEILKHKISFMEKTLEDTFIGSEKVTPKMKLCVLLIERIQADEYYENASRCPFMKQGTADYIHHGDGMIDQDLKMLFTIMEKECLKWWV